VRREKREHGDEGEPLVRKLEETGEWGKAIREEAEGEDSTAKERQVRLSGSEHPQVVMLILPHYLAAAFSGLDLLFMVN